MKRPFCLKKYCHVRIKKNIRKGAITDIVNIKTLGTDLKNTMTVTDLPGTSNSSNYSLKKKRGVFVKHHTHSA